MPIWSQKMRYMLKFSSMMILIFQIDPRLSKLENKRNFLKSTTEK
jgi:hypothetical protein